MNAILNALCDAQDSLQNCDSPDDLWRCGLRLFGAAGSACLTVGSIPRSRRDAPLLRTSLGADLMRDYIAENIHAEDPWMQYCAQSDGVDRPDVASGVRSNGPPMPPRMTDLFRTHGIHGVSLIPCAWGARSGGVALYATDRSSVKWFETEEGDARLRLTVALFAARYQPGMAEEKWSDLHAIAQPLTLREIEVLQWAANGLRTTQIAYRMGIREVTVSKHFQSLRKKLGARTTEQALAIALRDRLLPL
jgi:DNA-binding CsgD family transcriptional regulator